MNCEGKNKPLGDEDGRIKTTMTPQAGMGDTDT
jgi:hypothetical protein